VTVTFEPRDVPTNGEDPATQLDTLRKLLVGPEQSRIDELSEEIHSRELTPEELAARLPEAIALSGSRDDQLGRALGPTIDTALRESIRRDPQEMASAIFPVLGPAIRKAIAETMASLVRSINNAVEQSLSLNGMKWRMESWRTGIPYPEIVIKHALVYRVEQAFLIHAETGLLLEHVAAAELRVPDADLISSMLSAIQDFVRDSFRPGEGAMLRTFTVGEHTVQVEAGPRALLAVVVRGQAPDEVLRRQQTVLETVHLEFAGPLADFKGDAAPFAPARPLLEDCLETVLSTRSRARGSRVWMRWAIPLAVVLIILGGLWMRAMSRWNRAIAALREEPGLVVVNADRGFRAWEISGLRDPSARSPETVLAGIGIVPSSLHGRWEEYLSLNPVMVRSRALRAADSLRESIESDRVLFDAGSAALNQSAVALLSSVAFRYRQLESAAIASGAVVKVELIGRTDPTGRDETNAALAEQRPAAVAGWLVSSGIPAAILVRNPIATGSPLSSPDSTEQAQINRSVSFKLTMAPRPAAGGRKQ
jgi:outer membrane protein OmpA-like peptidoglycan-associated protein